MEQSTSYDNIQGQSPTYGWHKYLSEEDKDTIFSVSPKGWTDQVLGGEYLKAVSIIKLYLDYY